MKIIDLHCDTLLWSLFDEGNPLESEKRQISKEKLRLGKSLAQCFAIFTPANGSGSTEEQTENCYALFKKLLANYKAALEINNEWIAPAKCTAEIISNHSLGKISSILTIEDGTFIGEKMERLDEAAASGAKAIALTWNNENSIGYPNSDDISKHSLPLKPFGKELVEHLNEVSMIVDVSHLNEGGFWDVAELSKKPFIASHSCAKALVNHKRNLTDDQIKAIADAGGIIGACFYPPFASPSGTNTTVEDIVCQISHIISIGGEDIAAFGSDFDGMSDGSLEFNDFGGYQMIVEELSKKFKPQVVEKICFRNALRIFAS